MKIFFILLVIAVLGGAFYYFPQYAYFFVPCSIHEHEALPGDPENINFTYDSNPTDSPLQIVNFSACTQNTKQVRYFLTGGDPVGDQSLTSHVPRDTQFNIEKTIYLRNFGIVGVDAGTEWKKYFIASDGRNKYLVQCSDLALHSTLSESFLNCNQIPQ